MRKPKTLEIKHPERVTLNDCVLAHQMGYNAIIEDSKFKRFVRRKKA